MPEHYDVIVIGGGHAGLTAAITAAENGARVCMLESAPRAMRGGNSRHTRNLRPVHVDTRPPMSGVYDQHEYLDDLLRVTGGKTNQSLAALTLRESAMAIEWLVQRGVRFQPPLSGTLHLGRTNAFFLGGGKALVNALYAFAENLGITIYYNALDIQLEFVDTRFTGLSCQLNNVEQIMTSDSLVAASGGFEANLEWLTEIWGDAASNFLIRGTPYNRGDILKQLIRAGFRTVGEPHQCHAVAIDGRAPKFDGGIVSRVDCVPFGVVVNKNGERFHDEGEDFWPKRYASWGRLIANQPEQVAWAIIDDKVGDIFMPTVSKPVVANTIPGLASQLGVSADNLNQTLEHYNSAVRPGQFSPTELDDCHTENLAVKKSHWAQTLDKAPYRAYELRCGITFTYLGVAVDERARLMIGDEPSHNVFAAGEIMAGNVLGEGYLAGIGMTIGHVFGKIAGLQATRHDS